MKHMKNSHIVQNKTHIPESIRNFFNWNNGDMLGWYIDGNRVVLKKEDAKR